MSDWLPRVGLGLLVLLCASFCLTQLAEVDLHWHLLAGQRILQEDRVPRVDPFTYAIHGLKAILLKDGGFVSIQSDLLFLFVFGFGTLLVATPLFKRTL